MDNSALYATIGTVLIAIIAYLQASRSKKLEQDFADRNSKTAQRFAEQQSELASHKEMWQKQFDIQETRLIKAEEKATAATTKADYEAQHRRECEQRMAVIETVLKIALPDAYAKVFELYHHEIKEIK